MMLFIYVFTAHARWWCHGVEQELCCDVQSLTAAKNLRNQWNSTLSSFLHLSWWGIETHNLPLRNQRHMCCSSVNSFLKNCTSTLHFYTTTTTGIVPLTSPYSPSPLWDTRFQAQRQIFRVFSCADLRFDSRSITAWICIATPFLGKKPKKM